VSSLLLGDTFQPLMPFTDTGFPLTWKVRENQGINLVRESQGILLVVREFW